MPSRYPTSRDFVPWRFLDAGRLSPRRLSLFRRPKTCTVAEARRRIGLGGRLPEAWYQQQRDRWEFRIAAPQCSRSASRSRIRAAPRQRRRRLGSCAVRKVVLQTLPLISNVPCRFLSDKQIAASGPRQLSLCCWMFSIRNETTRQTSLADLHHDFFTQSLHLPSGLISPVKYLQDFSATKRLQSVHFLPSFGLGLYDTAFSCPYSIRTSAPDYFSEDSPPTKLKYDARAAI